MEGSGVGDGDVGKNKVDGCRDVVDNIDVDAEGNA